MPGDDWQRFANLRLLFGYMYAQPGKKLLFMENGSFWTGARLVARHQSRVARAAISGSSRRAGLGLTINRFYRSEPAMHVFDNNPAGIEWVDCNDNATSTISLLRKSENPRDTVLIVCNFTPVPRLEYRVGVPHGGYWREMLNSDAREYAGSGMDNLSASTPKKSPCTPAHIR